MECFETIEMMSAGEILTEEDKEDFCYRGLEYKTKEAYKERQRNKREVRNAVLDEQEFQSESNMEDPEWLAKLSRDESRSCVRAAYLAAKQDEMEAHRYLHQE